MSLVLGAWSLNHWTPPESIHLTTMPCHFFTIGVLLCIIKWLGKVNECPIKHFLIFQSRLIWNFHFFFRLCVSNFEMVDNFQNYTWFHCTESLFKVKVLVAHLCPTLCDSTDCSLPGSSIHWILQARVLEWSR